MTLQTNAMVKVDGDSSGAVEALKDVQKHSKDVASQSNTTASAFDAVSSKLTSLTAPISAVVVGYKSIKSALTSYMEAHKKGVSLMSQAGDMGWAGLAQAKAIMEAVDSQISMQTAATMSSKLMRSDFQLTEEQVVSVGKAAYALANAFAQSTDEMANMLTEAITSGNTKILRSYGIVIDEVDAVAAANEKALKEHGRLASKTEKANAKTTVVLKEIEKRYKNTHVIATRILEIETKHTNELERKKAIVALYNDTMANSLSAIKRGLTDVKENVLGIITGLGSLSAKELKAIRKGVMADIRMADDVIKGATKYRVDNMEKEAQSAKLRLEVEHKSLNIANDKDRIELQQKKAAATERLAEAKADRERLKTYIQMNEVVARVMSGNKAWRDAAADDIRDTKAKLEVLEKTIKAEEEINAFLNERADKYDYNKYAQNAEALADQTQIMTVGWVDTNKEVEQFIKKAAIAGKVTEDEKKLAEEIRLEHIKRHDALMKENTILAARIQQMMEQKDKGRALTAEQQAQLKYAQNQLKVNEQLLNNMLDQIPILKLLTKGLMPPAEKKEKVPVSQAYQEYQALMAVIKRGNLEATKAIEEAYGTLDPAHLLKVVRERHNKISKEEQKWVDEFIKREAEAEKIAEASAKKLNEIYTKSFDERLESINKEVEIETRRQKFEGFSHQTRLDQWNLYLEKVKRLADKELQKSDLDLTERDKIHKSVEEAEKKHQEALVILTAESYQKMAKEAEKAFSKAEKNIEDKDATEFRLFEDSYSKKLELARNHLAATKSINQAIIDDERTSADAKEAAAEKIKDSERKVTEVMREQAKERKDILDKAKSDILNYAQDVVRGAGGAMYDAMTMSDAAVKESMMSRGEIMKKALAQTFEQISKEAFIRSLMETAYGLADLAIGNPKASAHFAAAAVFAGIAGTSLAASRGMGAPSDAEIARRRNKDKGLDETKAAAVAGTTTKEARVFNIYWPAGIIMGDKDAVVKALKEAEAEADRRGRL